MRDAGGAEHPTKDGVRAWLASMLERGAWGAARRSSRAGFADDGRTCAVEATIVKRGGGEESARAVLFVVERGGERAGEGDARLRELRGDEP